CCYSPATTEIDTLSLHDALPILIVVASVDSTSSSNQYFLEIMTGGSGYAGRVYLLAANYASSYQVGGRRLDSDPARGYNVTPVRSEEHTSELQSRENLVCRLLLE